MYVLDLYLCKHNFIYLLIIIEHALCTKFGFCGIVKKNYSKFEIEFTNLNSIFTP